MSSSSDLHRPTPPIPRPPTSSIPRRIALGLLTLAAITGLAALLVRETHWGSDVWKQANALAERRECNFDDPLTCPADQICVKDSQGPSLCVPRDVGRTPFVRFPFQPSHPVKCILGIRSREGHHGKSDTLFAVDLATPPGTKPGTVHAAIDGTAIVFRSCKDTSVPNAPRPTGDDFACGSGFGNHVRILNSHRGLVALYAHLGTIWVEDGQIVSEGEAIGQEGRSGDAMARHLHFSIHRGDFSNWLEALYTYRNRPGVLPPAIPFETQYCDPEHSDPSECKRKRARVEAIPCAEPFKGAALRADWRT